MRTCIKCNLEKDLSSFSFKDKATGRRSTICFICSRAWSKAHYFKNKIKIREKLKESKKLYQQKLLDIVKQLKDNPCTDCNVKYPPVCMDFDHLRDKKFLISKAVRVGKSEELILKEIEKCELVCANCHRIRTQKRREDHLSGGSSAGRAPA